MPRLLFTLAVVIVLSQPSTAFIHCGLGYVNNTYPFDDDIEDGLGLDLGFYLPRSNRLLLVSIGM